MVVCFSIGKTSQMVISKIQSILDNVEFHSFSTIQDIVKEAQLRHLNFKRIIISNSLLKDIDGDLEELNSFIKNYSSSTEVVLIVNKNVVNYKEIEEKFCKVFNSPMYTVAELQKVTPRDLSEIVTSDILYIQETYFKGKSELFNNSAKISESSIGVENIESHITNTGEVDANNSEEIIGNQTSFSAVNMDSPIKIQNIQEERDISNSDLISSSPVSVGVGSDLEDNFNDLSEDLSLGSFGSSHSDTGFLDEEDDSDLQEYIKNKQNEDYSKESIIDNPECNSRVNVIPNQYSPNIISTEQSYIPYQQTTVNPIPNKPQIDIIMSLRGSSTYLELLEEANKIVYQDNARVLIIDLDFRENVLLSSIDINSFYKEGYYLGIRQAKALNINGLSLLSNGYGVWVSEMELSSILNSDWVKQYNMIYVYCPLDCISSIPESVLQSTNIILNPGNNLSDYISTSLLLTSRDITTIEKERIIMSSCLLDMQNYSQEDILKLKNICIFANGSWLDRIGL